MQTYSSRNMILCDAYELNEQSWCELYDRDLFSIDLLEPCQLLGAEDAELLLSVSESVSSLPLLAALWDPGLVMDASIPHWGSESSVFQQVVCAITAGGLLINVGTHCW